MMTRDRELEIVRRAYAKQVTNAAGATDPRLEAALAELHREDFVPPGPWELMRFPEGYVRTADDDPVYLYQDVPVALLPEKGLNNSQPSFLARLIAIGRLRPGERVVHVGAGTGYYSAMMGRLVGRAGRVVGFEVEPKLASCATKNLASYSNVDLVLGDGSTTALEPSDVILVNAGASRPADTWLDALRPGGRLVLPLTISYRTDQQLSMSHGAVFLIARDMHGNGYAARCMSSVHIYPCAGLRDEISEKALKKAFGERGFQSKLGTVSRLYRTDSIREERCWVRAPGWSLAYD